MTEEPQVMPLRSSERNEGKALRRQVPRSSHANWAPDANRPDPLDLLQAQDAGRLQHLIPIKYGRMLESPFAFLRGSAAVMAADLTHTPVIGADVILCGDAHLSNFGVFATPERRLVFDINDFDEVYPGPWEWDLKRLAASAVVAARENGFREKDCRGMAIAATNAYREAIKRMSAKSTLAVWYFHVDADDVVDLFGDKSSKAGHKSAKKMVAKARSRTQAQTLEKLTYVENGRRRITSDPPLLVPYRIETIHELLGHADSQPFTEADVENVWGDYLESLPDERRFLLQRYRIVDAALRVGGVGSVGTRCSIILLEGEGGIDDTIVLQLKEAGPSALETYLGSRGYRDHAERVVTGQRLMQAASDIFLGWHTSAITDFNYYWRQLKDMKGSLDVASMDKSGFQTYARVCAVCLARAHARTGDEAMILGYLGKSDSFSEAIADFAVAYADQTERDYQALVNAVKSGRIEAETGV